MRRVHECCRRAGWTHCGERERRTGRHVCEPIVLGSRAGIGDGERPHEVGVVGVVEGELSGRDDGLEVDCAVGVDEPCSSLGDGVELRPSDGGWYRAGGRLEDVADDLWRRQRPVLGDEQRSNSRDERTLSTNRGGSKQSQLRRLARDASVQVGVRTDSDVPDATAYPPPRAVDRIDPPGAQSETPRLTDESNARVSSAWWRKQNDQTSTHLLSHFGPYELVELDVPPVSVLGKL